jgi:hypothetical protein
MGLFDFFRKQRTPADKPKGGMKKEISSLEKAGLLFFKNQKYASALVVFEKLVTEEPHNSNAWYGIGNAIAQLCNEKKRPDLLPFALAAFKKAIQTNGGSHRISEEFSETIIRTLQLGENEVNGIVPMNPEQLTLLIEEFKIGRDELVSEFAGLTADKMVIVMFLGDSGQQVFFPYLKQAVLNETDIDVRYAALKRLRFYKGHPELEDLFSRAISSQKSDELEPYLSMALHAMDEPWAEKFKGPAYKNIFK